MSWWESVVDAVPVVGTGYRSARAVAAHMAGDHEGASQQWAEAGMNLAGDAAGLVTGGAGKVAATAAKAAVKHGAKAAIRAAGRQLTIRAMKGHAKRYVKKKMRKALKDGMRQARDEMIDALSEVVSDYSRAQLARLSDQELISIAQTCIQELDDDDDY